MKNICKNNSIFYILQILKLKYLNDADIALNVLQFYPKTILIFLTEFACRRPTIIIFFITAVR